MDLIEEREQKGRRDHFNDNIINRKLKYNDDDVDGKDDENLTSQYGI